MAQVELFGQLLERVVEVAQVAPITFTVQLQIFQQAELQISMVFLQMQQQTV